MISRECMRLGANHKALIYNSFSPDFDLQRLATQGTLARADVPRWYSVVRALGR